MHPPHMVPRLMPQAPPPPPPAALSSAGPTGIHAVLFSPDSIRTPPPGRSHQCYASSPYEYSTCSMTMFWGTMSRNVQSPGDPDADAPGRCGLRWWGKDGAPGGGGRLNMCRTPAGSYPGAMSDSMGFRLFSCQAPDPLLLPIT